MSSLENMKHASFYEMEKALEHTRRLYENRMRRDHLPPYINASLQFNEPLAVLPWELTHSIRDPFTSPWGYNSDPEANHFYTALTHIYEAELTFVVARDNR